MKRESGWNCDGAEAGARRPVVVYKSAAVAGSPRVAGPPRPRPGGDHRAKMGLEVVQTPVEGRPHRFELEKRGRCAPATWKPRRLAGDLCITTGARRPRDRGGADATWAGEIGKAGWPRYPRHGRRGVGLVELLIALAITAALLTATAVAIQASFTGYKVNQEQATLIQRARLTLNRILAEIRTTQSHEPITAAAKGDFLRGTITRDRGIALFLDDFHGVTFEWSDGRLLRRPFTLVGGVASNQPAQVLLAHVENFEVTFESQASEAAVRQYGHGVFDQLRRATLTITVGEAAGPDSTGTQRITLSCSVMPRRNLW